MTDLKAALTDEETIDGYTPLELVEHALAGHVPKMRAPDRRGLAEEILRIARGAVLAAAPGPALRGEGGSYAASSDASDARQTRAPHEWQTIESAPRDGTPILAWCVHPNARYAGDDKDWCAPVVTQWTTFNEGGWTWHGMLGTFTHWMPLPNPPGAEVSAHTDEALIAEALNLDARGNFAVDVGVPDYRDIIRRLSSALASRLATITPEQEAVARIIGIAMNTSCAPPSADHGAAWVRQRMYDAADQIIALFNTGKAETP